MSTTADKMLAALSLEWAFAREVGERAGVSTNAAGSVLAALERQGYVESRPYAKSLLPGHIIYQYRVASREAPESEDTR
jgi:DNA-binding IclR family transcriptional regulator